ncbi:translation initiation factor IF-3 [Candidatus Parcubacteria bacterium]|jgi:translation initiation factor IF-3|nr:translation initiation factor IF-3 [Candidatus Parcubacteria bacterium]MBT7227998.1 translation initiation factor IF-3 [Candidatus Parcubacteria bacterium]
MVIGDDGEQLGVIPTSQALDLAEQKGLDLVEVSPKANPPVCRIIDYGKFQYQQTRSQQKVKKVEIKGIRLSLKIGEHDLEVKEKQALKFLDQGHKVKIELRLKGRERAPIFRTKSRDKINQFLEQLKSNVDFKIDKPIEQQGPTITVLITKGN